MLSKSTCPSLRPELGETPTWRIPPPANDAAPLDAVKRDDGIWVGVKRACENVGLDFSAQCKRLKTAGWASVAVIATQLPGDVQTRETFMLRSDRLAMWLATIEASRVRDDIRPKLERYQNEAADALAPRQVPANVGRDQTSDEHVTRKAQAAAAGAVDCSKHGTRWGMGEYRDARQLGFWYGPGCVVELR